MFVKVVLVVSVLKICAGEEDTANHQPHSNQAIFSQSFVRHDVPLSYKYSAVHVYTTPKPNQQQHEPLPPQHHQIRTQLPKEIQYAPIYDGQPEPNDYGKHPKLNGVQQIPEKNLVTVEKSNLEPKPHGLYTSVHTPDHLTYIPGYNVELLQAGNRFPGHNAVYRSYPHMSPNNKINNVNYLKQYVLYQKPEEEYITPKHTVTESVATKLAGQVDATLSPFVPKQQRVALVGQQPKLYNAAHIATLKAAASPQALINLQEIVPHPKAHRMLLNIARNYNIAGSPMKAQHSSLTLLKHVPPYSQEIIQFQRPAELEKNTKLLPIPNNPIH